MCIGVPHPLCLQASLFSFYLHMLHYCLTPQILSNSPVSPLAGVCLQHFQLIVFFILNILFHIFGILIKCPFRYPFSFLFILFFFLKFPITLLFILNAMHIFIILMMLNISILKLLRNFLVIFISLRVCRSADLLILLVCSPSSFSLIYFGI